MATFTRQDIEEGLRRLGEIAQAKGLQIKLILVGGAVMALRFNARPSTRDVDAVILLPREARLSARWQDKWRKNGIGPKTG